MAKVVKSALASRFTKVDANAAKQRLIGGSYGEVGTLKTSFWLGAPGPMLVQNLDNGLEGVIEEYQKLKDIYVETYNANTDGVEQEEAIVERDRFISDFEDAITNGIRTIIWDKETQVYELFKYAEFGAPSSNPNNYYPLFQRYRRLFNMAKASDINFGVIQGMQTPWGSKVNLGNGKTAGARLDGQRKRRGMAEVEELVQVNIEHYLDAEVNEFKMKIGKVRGPGARDIQNEVIDALTFVEFVQLVFPDSDESDWL